MYGGKGYLQLSHGGRERMSPRIVDVGKRSFAPASWVKVGLAVLPGLYALALSSGLLRSVLSARTAQTLASSGLSAMCILLIVAGFIREHRIAVWSFPALGILLFPASGILVLGEWWGRLSFVEEANPIWHPASFILFVLALTGIGTFAVYRVWRQHRTRIPRLALVLLGLVILAALADVAASAIADRSPDKWRAVLVVLPSIVLKAGMILSPVAIGLLLARSNGLLAGLIVVAADFVLVDWILDPGYALGAWTANQTLLKAVYVLPVTFFLAVSPIWVLRSRSTRGRAWALLLPVFIGLIGTEIISGSVRPYYSDIWLTRAIGGAEFLIALALTAVAYHWIGDKGATDSQEDRGALAAGSIAATGENTRYEPWALRFRQSCGPQP